MTLLLCILVLLALVPATAYAYIDPGSGSLLLQGLIAVIVGGWLATRLFFRRFWDRLRGSSRRQSDSLADEAHGQDETSGR